MTDQPASTITELRQILIDFEANRPRSMQKELGPSELGTPCQQQIARKLAGAPRRPITEPTWAPFQGTAVHASMEDVVAFWNTQLGRERWLAEDRLVVDPGPGHYPSIEGNGDAFDLDHNMVVDWKHVGTTALKKLRTAKRMGKPPRDQVSQDYRIQAHLYGLGHANKGRPVQHVRLVLLARSWKYDDSDVVDQVARITDGSWHHDAITNVTPNPSQDACHWCPFMRAGQPSDWHGCAGDEQVTERRSAAFAAGLI
jgi:hypothetical protein